jgi:signal transduction histidine kinase
LNLEQASGSLIVQADQVHLQQVLVNLAVNGMDAMQGSEHGDRRLTFETIRNGNSQVEVSITDSGDGVPSENLEGIFETFFTTKPDGTGLGLSIARTIVETYGGKIWAENRSSGGAAFRFTLPLAQVHVR